MKLQLKTALLYALGALCSTVPVAVAVLSYFPLWVARDSETAVSGLCLCLLLVSALPLLRVLRGAWKTPSVTVLWGILFLLFFALSRIADEVTAIALCGFISNLIGSLFFMLARRLKRESDR